jgi:hypothetical protein
MRRDGSYLLWPGNESLFSHPTGNFLEAHMKIGSGFGNSKLPRRLEPTKAAIPASQRSTPWHAVSITTKNTSCIAARALHNTRFLSARAPRLPLAECSMGGACPCAYKHHADRRGPPRRKDEITGIKQTNRLAQERRVSPTRRIND